MQYNIYFLIVCYSYKLGMENQCRTNNLGEINLLISVILECSKCLGFLCVHVLKCSISNKFGINMNRKFKFMSVQSRVHNTLQRVSNANYHCTNTLRESNVTSTWDLLRIVTQTSCTNSHCRHDWSSDRSAVVFLQVARAMLKVQLLRTFVRTKYCRKSGHSFNRRTRIMLFCAGQ